VRSVLERLGGGGQKPVTPDAASATPESAPPAEGSAKTN
jgi:hypothetical protein